MSDRYARGYDTLPLHIHEAETTGYELATIVSDIFTLEAPHHKVPAR